MNTQQYLLSGKTHADLTQEYGIRLCYHDKDPLVILNYHQIDSPKTHPIVRECRGLVLHTETHDVIARSFPRFFNWGEVQDEMKHFDFSDFFVQSKEDGSLVLLYHFDGKWRANTRGSFATEKINYTEMSWQDAFCRATGTASLDDFARLGLDTECTYVCEFVSPWNKVVRQYHEPAMFLLTVYRGVKELSQTEVDSITPPCFRRPQQFRFSSIEEIQAFLKRQAEIDQTFEGVVICDRHGQRWKIKSPTYLSLHRMLGNDNLYNPKNLLPFILSGEDDELLTYFPEVESVYREHKATVESAYAEMVAVWERAKGLPVQKDFALAVVGKTKFTGILFEARKHGRDPKDVWRESGDAILKALF